MFKDTDGRFNTLSEYYTVFRMAVALRRCRIVLKGWGFPASGKPLPISNP